ncbi:MAG: hypothetical protein D6758_13935 [Gammaproteobacteria bacterium]|nr:MAG: hypothetical protein D6758_13935 [Gammaproteobacteria bacterium]
MKTRLMMTGLIGALFLASASWAGTPGLDIRETHQKHRIVQGVANGELTARETARLVKGQRELRRMERRAKSDGVVTLRERARLHHKADVESARIYRNKHDSQTR